MRLSSHESGHRIGASEREDERRGGRDNRVAQVTNVLSMRLLVATCAD
jgi:hypothetical protein